MTKVSIVSTLYKSKPFLDQFLDQMLAALSKLDIRDFEIVFVNDGSPDDSLSFLLERKKSLPQIVVVDLSRNFGHHYAMQAGLSHATGEYIFLIDNDLETSPDFIVPCFKLLDQDSTVDVVYGYQEVRKGSFTESFGGKVFWWAINKVSDVKIPKNMLTERLMRRRYLDSLLTLGDANLFLGGLMHWTGYKQVGLPVARSVRKGASTYSTKKRLELMIQAVTSFSGKPLEYLFYMGLLITGGSLLSILFFIGQKIIYGERVQLGWTSLVVLNVLILGIISTFLGLTGIYIFKIFKQVQQRPNAIIRQVYR